MSRTAPEATLAQESRPAPPPTALYVHVPFCVRTCPYCDFFKLAPTGRSWGEQYLDALRREAALRLDPTARFTTIFVGGGTPTELPPAERLALAAWLTTLAEPGAEITWEANPGTADRGLFAELLAAGVTRLSIGAQSFSDRLLARLGRVHDARAITRACDDARAAVCRNLSLDLLHAIPTQTRAELARDLATITTLADHVSAYCLTYEPGTAFGHQLAAGTLTPLDEDTELEQLDLVHDTLAARGFAPYEISNYAGVGGPSRHNLVYWTYGRYHALGPSASAFVGWERRTGARNLERWLESDGQAAELVETIDPDTARREVLMLGLRLDAGLARADLLERSGQLLGQAAERAAAALVARGLVDDDGATLRLTRRGRWLHNRVAVELF